MLQHLQNYRQKWIEHVNRMGRSRLPKQILNYQARGKRRLGRPKKRWHESGTGQMA